VLLHSDDGPCEVDDSASGALYVESSASVKEVIVDPTELLRSSRTEQLSSTVGLSLSRPSQGARRAARSGASFWRFKRRSDRQDNHWQIKAFVNQGRSRRCLLLRRSRHALSHLLRAARQTGMRLAHRYGCLQVGPTFCRSDGFSVINRATGYLPRQLTRVPAGQVLLRGEKSVRVAFTLGPSASGRSLA
jgi:hypothetical protein